jgi:hypothetical protein
VVFGDDLCKTERTRWRMGPKHKLGGGVRVGERGYKKIRKGLTRIEKSI